MKYQIKRHKAEHTKQEEDKPSMECTKVQTGTKDNVKSIVNAEWLDKFAENTEEFIIETNDHIKEALKKTSCESFVA